MVIRLNSQRSSVDGADHSTIRIAVTLADVDSAQAQATIIDAARELGLSCSVEET